MTDALVLYVHLRVRVCVCGEAALLYLLAMEPRSRELLLRYGAVSALTTALR